MATILGIDLGGTSMRMATIDKKGLGIDGHPSIRPSPTNLNSLIEIIVGHLTNDTQGIGIAVAGVVENHRNVVHCPSLHWLDNTRLKKIIEETTKLRAVISNDMEAAAIGENEKGQLGKYHWSVFDTISTGWGGVLKLDGKIVTGEPGHVNVSFNKNYRCGCGNVGCNEAMYSGSALEKHILHVMRTKNHESQAPWPFFYSELEHGKDWAVALCDEWAEGVGRAWANVLNRIRPMQAIIYMGTTAEELMPRAKKKVRSTIQRICMFPEHKSDRFPIVPATERNRSVIGAAKIYLTNNR